MNASVDGDGGEVVVIGGGIAGLVCANLLADAGGKVTVLESAETPGGRARTTRASGFRFNLGPHAVYDEGAFARVLKELGIEVRGRRPTGPYFTRFNGELRRLPTGPWSLLRSGLLGMRGMLSFMGFMSNVSRLDPDRADLEETTARDWLDANVEHPTLKAIAEAFIRLATYACELDSMSASLAIRQLQLANAGVTYPDGGWGRLVDKLTGRLRGRGGEIRTGIAATNIQIRGPSFRVSVRDGADPTPRAVVVATPPEAARRILGDELAERAGIPRNPTPVLASCLDLGLDRSPRPDRPLLLGLDSPVYVSDHGEYADLTERDGGTVVHAARYLKHDPSLDAADTRSELEAGLDALQPGWRDRVVESRFLSRMRVVSNLVTAADGGFSGRPSPVVDSVPGLCIAGDWVGESGWLSNASAASARDAAAALLERSRVQSKTVSSAQTPQMQER